MSNSYQSCTISKAPFTGKGYIIPLAETPYKLEPTEHGPFWLFSLPFKARDNGGWRMHTPASPGDSENNTPQEVEESVVAAASIRHIQEVIDSTTPDMSALEQVTAGNKFVHFRPWRLEFSGDTREDAARLIENEHGGFHIFSECAAAEFIA